MRGSAEGGIGATMWGNGFKVNNVLEYANQPSDGGCWLNDFRAFQGELQDSELAKIRREFWKSGFTLIVK